MVGIPPLKKESVGIRRSHAERYGVLSAECCALKSVRPAHVTEDSGVRSYAGRNSGYQQMVGAVGTNQDEEGSLRRSKGVGRAVSEARPRQDSEQGLKREAPLLYAIA